MREIERGERRVRVREKGGNELRNFAFFVKNYLPLNEVISCRTLPPKKKNEKKKNGEK